MEDCVRGSTWIRLPCQLFISLKTSHVRLFADLFQILPGTQNNFSDACLGQGHLIWDLFTPCIAQL